MLLIFMLWWRLMLLRRLALWSFTLRCCLTLLLLWGSLMLEWCWVLQRLALGSFTLWCGLTLLLSRLMLLLLRGLVLLLLLNHLTLLLLLLL